MTYRHIRYTHYFVWPVPIWKKITLDYTRGCDLQDLSLRCFWLGRLISRRQRPSLAQHVAVAGSFCCGPYDQRGAPGTLHETQSDDWSFGTDGDELSELRPDKTLGDELRAWFRVQDGSLVKGDSWELCSPATRSRNSGEKSERSASCERNGYFVWWSIAGNTVA